MPRWTFRHGRLAPLVAAVVAALGIGVAVAVAAVTTSTSVSCATTTAASHTVGVDGTPVSTVGGDSLSVCATATATATNQTVTVTTTVPATTTAATTTAPVTTTTVSNPPASSGGTPGIGVLAYGGNLKYVTNLNSYSMVIGSSYSSDTSLLAGAAGRSLTYFDGMDVSKTYSEGVTYTDALNNGWLLKDSAGNYMVNSTYGTYCADVGSSGYQQKWISDVEAYIAAHPGLDGTFIDNVMYDPKGECGGYPAKYPTTASWDTAMISFVSAVHTALQAKGYYVALNAGAYIPGDTAYNDGTSVVNWFKQVGPYADGLMNEYYDETSDGTYRVRTTGTAWYQNFDSWQRVVGAAQSQGDDFIGLTKSSGMNTAMATYGKASFLLEWNGGGGAYIYTCGGTCNPTNSSWTTDIGQPSGAKFAVGVGYERAYTKGTVLVNPSPSSSQTFTVNGTSYTLAATTAKIIVG